MTLGKKGGCTHSARNIGKKKVIFISGVIASIITNVKGDWPKKKKKKTVSNRKRKGGVDLKFNGGQSKFYSTDIPAEGPGSRMRIQRRSTQPTTRHDSRRERGYHPASGFSMSIT